MHPADIRQYAENYLVTQKTKEVYTDLFIDEIRNFVEQISKQVADARSYFGEEKEYSSIMVTIVDQLAKVSQTQLNFFLDTCLLKYRKAYIEPGK
jgi:uncharacterized protein (UPF0305 family)